MIIAAHLSIKLMQTVQYLLVGEQCVIENYLQMKVNKGSRTKSSFLISRFSATGSISISLERLGDLDFMLELLDSRWPMSTVAYFSSISMVRDAEWYYQPAFLAVREKKVVHRVLCSEAGARKIRVMKKTSNTLSFFLNPVYCPFGRCPMIDSTL